MAYVWFDEPEPTITVVADGAAAKQYARLRRMLTEQPGDNQLAGLVDIKVPGAMLHHRRPRSSVT
jgi:hypothetical protein